MLVNAVVFAVSVCPNTAVPVIVTVPASVALSVVNVLGSLLGLALYCVVVSLRRAINVYSVSGSRKSKVVEDCQVAPLSLEYSAYSIVLSIIVVAVLDDRVGAAGAGRSAFSIVICSALVSEPT